MDLMSRHSSETLGFLLRRGKLTRCGVLLPERLSNAFGDATADGERVLGEIPAEDSAAPPPFNVVPELAGGAEEVLTRRWKSSRTRR
jgi:hypothetical protein